MKKFICYLFLALMPMCFAACGSDDSDSHDSQVIGTWTGNTTNYTGNISYAVTYVYHFESNGECYFNEWWHNESPELKYFGTWSTSNNFITILEEDEDGDTNKHYYRYELSNGGKTMTFYKKDDNGEYTKLFGVFTKH